MGGDAAPRRFIEVRDGNNANAAVLRFTSAEWAAWLDGALWFSTGGTSAKGRNLAREPRCTLTLDDAGMQVVVEGTSRRVTDEQELRRFAEVYSPKYEWPIVIRDGSIDFEDGNSGYVYAVRAETVFAFIEEPFATTRWRF